MGYKDPPSSGQIKPGETRNRKGRPTGSKNRKTIVREIASRYHHVVIEGERQRVNVMEALLLRLQFMAIEKGGKALREYQRLVETYDLETEENKGYGVLVVPPEMAVEELADLHGLEVTDREPPPFLRVLYEVHYPEVFKSEEEDK